MAKAKDGHYFRRIRAGHPWPACCCGAERRGRRTSYEYRLPGGEWTTERPQHTTGEEEGR